MKKYLILLAGILMHSAVFAQTQRVRTTAKSIDTTDAVKSKYDYQAKYNSGYTPQTNVQQSQKNSASMSATPNVKSAAPTYQNNTSYTREQMNTDYNRAGTRSNMNSGANRDQSYSRQQR